MLYCLKQSPQMMVKIQFTFVKIDKNRQMASGILVNPNL